MTDKQLAPIPAEKVYDEHSEAMQAALQKQGFFTREIRDGIYLLTEGWYHVLVVPTKDGTIVVDAPPTISPDFYTGRNLIKGVESITDIPVTHLVYSHHHHDHIGGAHNFPEGIDIVAQEECARYLRDANDPDRPVPTTTFKDKMTLKVGEQTLMLDYRGDIHCNGNIFVHAPDQKILMLIDVIFPGWAPFSSLAMASDLRGFMRGHDEVLAYDFDTLVSGHLTRLGKREDVEVQKEYFLDIHKTARKYLGERFRGCVDAAKRTEMAKNPMDVGDFMTIGQELGFENAWAVFDRYLNNVADAITEEVEPRWLGKLAAVDVFTRSHAWEVAERMRIDA
jgi:glyoxylase-like metal-dependent hydrolase (beta-lactamase superfamily II)